MTGHTPTPWRIHRAKEYLVVSGNNAVDEGRVASCASYDNAAFAEENAAFIVRACNSHDDLVAALEAWRAFSGCCLHESTFASPAFIEARKLTRAALAKAGAS